MNVTHNDIQEEKKKKHQKFIQSSEFHRKNDEKRDETRIFITIEQEISFLHSSRMNSCEMREIFSTFSSWKKGSKTRIN